MVQTYLVDIDLHQFLHQSYILTLSTPTLTYTHISTHTLFYDSNLDQPMI